MVPSHPSIRLCIAQLYLLTLPHHTHAHTHSLTHTCRCCWGRPAAASLLTCLVGAGLSCDPPLPSFCWLVSSPRFNLITSAFLVSLEQGQHTSGPPPAHQRAAGSPPRPPQALPLEQRPSSAVVPRNPLHPSAAVTAAATLKAPVAWCVLGLCRCRPLTCCRLPQPQAFYPLLLPPPPLQRDQR